MEENRCKDIVNCFFQELYNQNALLQHFFEEIVSFREMLKPGFALGIRHNNVLTVYTLSKVKKKEKVKRYVRRIPRNDKQVHITTKIEDIFAGIVIEKNAEGIYTKILRCIFRDRDLEIYYFSCFLKQNLFNITYLQNVEFEYCRWISWLLTCFLSITLKTDTKENTKENAENSIGGLDAIKVTDKMMNIKMHRIQDSFHETVLALLKVDLDFIISLSGAYYEGDECSAVLEYCLIYSVKDKKMAIELDNPVEISENNVRKIRKLIQMVQEGQCLVAAWESGRWSIRGICDNEQISEKYITFRFMRHMVWTMEYMGKTMICYNCGRYCIDSKELKIKEFCEKYKQVFKEEANKCVISVIDRAIDQTHGTTLLMLDKERILNEIGNLLGNEIGFKIQEVKCQTSRNIIAGITSIDGATLLDQEGSSHGMGIILANTAKKTTVGRSERGARFNSAKNYIDSCKKRKIAAMVIVVSSDRTVDILTTKDA